MDTELWNLPPSRDDCIVTISNCEPFIIDRAGFLLFQKYGGCSIGGWHYNSKIGHLHRREYYTLNGKGINGVHEKIILFHLELLCFPVKGEVATYFVNGNRRDYRRVNFLFWPRKDPQKLDNS